MTKGEVFAKLKHLSREERRAFDRLACLGLIVVVAVGAVAIWVKSPAFTGQAEAIAGATQGISPHELLLRIDIKSLPVQETGDPI